MLNELRSFVARRFPRALTALRVLRGHEYFPAREGWVPIFIEYPVNCSPRWGRTKPLHPTLLRIFEKGRGTYADELQSILPFTDELMAIRAQHDPGNPLEPNWINGWLPELDGIAIYKFLAERDRGVYLEVGSGNSTKFARKAIRDHGRSTRIVSIDPAPRAEIDQLCDEVIRQRLQDIDLSVFDRLEEGDVVFVDNSHYAFMNSDVTVFFLDVLPRIKPGVVVAIHDICLPEDYPPNWDQKYYNEQYLLACWLLGGGAGMEILLPSWFASADPELAKILAPLTNLEGMPGQTPRGVALWFRTKAV